MITVLILINIFYMDCEFEESHFKDLDAVHHSSARKLSEGRRLEENLVRVPDNVVNKQDLKMISISNEISNAGISRVLALAAWTPPSWAV